MHQIEQFKFVPLTDMICFTIAQLNKTNIPARLETIQQYIFMKNQTLETPSIRILQTLIDNLERHQIVYSNHKQFYIHIPASAPYHSMKQSPRKTIVKYQTKSTINSVQEINTKVKKGKKYKKLMCNLTNIVKIHQYILFL